MLSQDVQKLKQTLKSTRRNRKFQTQFAPLLNSTPPTSHTHTLLQTFNTKFPQLTYLKQIAPYNYSYCSMNQNTQNMTVCTNKSQRQDGEELNKEDQMFWRRYYGGIREMPVMESNQEIGRLIQVIRELQVQQRNIQNTNNTTNNNTNTNTNTNPTKTPTKNNTPSNKLLTNLTPDTIYDHIYEIYQDKGGDKNYQELKQKIQADIRKRKNCVI